jgi:hypothetical protein
MLGLQGFDSDYLGAATPTAQRDLVIVRGSPTLRSRRRPVKRRAGAPDGSDGPGARGGPAPSGFDSRSMAER